MNMEQPNADPSLSKEMANIDEELPKPTRIKLRSPSLQTRESPLDSDPPTHDPFLPGYFFFYGTLMNPATLANIIQVSEPPQMQPARVIGYSVKMHGTDPALLWGPPENPVDGVACEISLREHFDRICGHGTENYEANPCYIELVGESGESEDTIKGETFIWKGDYEELRD